jgi:hypothetical protein
MNIDFSSPIVIAVLAFIVLALIAGVIVYAQKRKARLRLRTHFGTEYERAVLEHGSERKAEAVLVNRKTRVEKLPLRELGVAQRERFVSEWSNVQSRFVDHPRGAVTEADELITSLLQARGYAVSGFEESAADVSVSYPGMVEDYRSAHSISARSGRGEASTEELRTAMIQYRSLFDELVKPDVTMQTRSVA